MHNRIKAIRNALKLSQSDFGKEIGLSKFAISNYENNKTPVTERSIADICRVFRVNEEWLRFGTGEMFAEQSDDLDYMIAKYGYDLSDTQKQIIIAMLKMDEVQRKALDAFIDNLLSLREKTQQKQVDAF